MSGLDPNLVLDLSGARTILEAAAKLRQDTRGAEWCEVWPWDDMSEQAKIAWVLMASRMAPKPPSPDTVLLDGLQKLFDSGVVVLRTCRSGCKIETSRRGFQFADDCRAPNEDHQEFFGQESIRRAIKAAVAELKC